MSCRVNYLLSDLTRKGMLLSSNVGCGIIGALLACCRFSHAVLSFATFVICWCNDPADGAYCLTYVVCDGS